MNNPASTEQDQFQPAPSPGAVALPSSPPPAGSERAAPPDRTMVKVRIYPRQPAPLAGWLMGAGGAAIAAGTLMPWIWVPFGLLSTDRLYAQGTDGALMFLGAVAIMLAGDEVKARGSGSGRLIGATFAAAAGALALWRMEWIRLAPTRADEYIAAHPESWNGLRPVTSVAPGPYVILAGAYLALLATLLQHRPQRIVVLEDR